MNDNGNMSNPACVNFEFFRSSSASKQEKIKDFWKYLDSQDILEPVRASKVDAKVPDDSSCVRDIQSCSQSASANVKQPSVGLKPRTSTKKTVKEDKCHDPSSKVERYLREDLRYADSVEVPYEDINAEIEDYQRRLLRCGCKNEKCDCKRKIPKKKRPSK